MMIGAKIPGQTASAPASNSTDPTASAGPAPATSDAQTAGNTIAGPKEQLAGGILEFASPPAFEQAGTSKGGASKDYLSPDAATEVIVSVLPTETTWNSSTGPLQLNTAKRELAPTKPSAGPELLSGGKMPIEIHWSTTKDGKPANGYRLFRKVGPRIPRCDVITIGDPAGALQIGEQVLLSMTSTQSAEDPKNNVAETSSHASLETKANQRAQAALEQAKKLATDRKDDEAYTKFKYILNEYPGSTAATEARQAVDNYEADPTFANRHKKAPTGNNDDKAAGALAMADNYATLGKVDAAKEKYQQIIAQYPNTPSAAKAKKRLANLATGH